MSAYALPGNFFSTSTTFSSVQVESTKPHHILTIETASVDFSSEPSKTNKKYEYKDSLQPGTALKTEANIVDNDLLNTSCTDGSSSKVSAGGSYDIHPSWFSSNSERFVTIKSATVDPIRLIQAFTNCRKVKFSKNKCKSSKTCSSRKLPSNSLNSSPNYNADPCLPNFYSEINVMSSNENVDNELDKVVYSKDFSISDLTSTFVSDVCKTSSKTNLIEHASHQASQSSDQSDSLTTLQVDAIQFKLSIKFNGRKYTATRTLPSFVKLRNDLLQELSGHNKNSSGRGRKRRQNTSTLIRTSFGRLHLQPEETSNFEGENQVLNFLQESQNETAKPRDGFDFNRIDTIIIPELPIGGKRSGGFVEQVQAGSMSMVGFAGRGFTRLHAILRCYCPAMESWLRQVAYLIPPNSSPTLSSFLWEPIQAAGHNDCETSNVGGGLSAHHPLSSKFSSNGSLKKDSRFLPKNGLRGISSWTTLASISEDTITGDED